MRKRTYYSVRSGKNQNLARLDLPTLARLFRSLYANLDREGYFQESFGADCVDAGFTPGVLGRDIEESLMLALRKEGLWPVYEKLSAYSEDDLFDIIEFLHDHISKPTERYWHGFADCGWHCQKFDQHLGRTEFRDKVNELLMEYDGGFELTERGEIVELPEFGMETLLEATLPVGTDTDIQARVQAAISKFRRHRSTGQDRRDALRDLADVLEFLRPQVKRVLSSKDEDDLFNLANNFGIRHHNAKQKIEYNKGIWYSWAFYYYLATIHASLRLLNTADKSANPAGS